MGNCVSSSAKDVSKSSFGDWDTRTFDVERLKSLDLFVLDNTIRETNVGQLKGHVFEDNVGIFAAIQGLGLTDFIIATFSELYTVDDEVAELVTVTENQTNRNFYCFSELYDRSQDNTPSLAIPVQLEKCIRYNIQNVILEFDLIDEKIDDLDRNFSPEVVVDMVESRIGFIMKHRSKGSRILLNLRDALLKYFQKDEGEVFINRPRIVAIITLLANMMSTEKILFAVLIEEPTGLLFPWMIAEFVRFVRSELDRKEHARNIHLLVHVHKGNGLAEANVLAALSNGATGIWCAICEEGAIVGHSCSLMTLTNLARLGNTTVTRRFDLAKMRTAAIKVTTICTNRSPPYRQELYGAGAFDLIMPVAFTAAGDPAGLFHLKSATRMSTISTVDMIGDHLREVFGPHPYPKTTLANMREILLSDLRRGKKLEYHSSLGLLSLYERAGGHDWLESMYEKVQLDPAYDKFSEHRLMVELKALFLANCDGCSEITTEDIIDPCTELKEKDEVSSISKEMSLSDNHLAKQQLSRLTFGTFEFSRKDSLSVRTLFDTTQSHSSVVDSAIQLEDELLAPMTQDLLEPSNQSNVPSVKELQTTKLSTESLKVTSTGIEDTNINTCNTMSYQRFSEVFLVGSKSPEVLRHVMKYFDADRSGDIAWAELHIRGCWALQQYHHKIATWTLSDFISAILELYVDITAFGITRGPASITHSRSVFVRQTKTWQEQHFHESLSSGSSKLDRSDPTID